MVYVIMICYVSNLFFHSLKSSSCGSGGGGGGHPLLSQSSLLYAACDNSLLYAACDNYLSNSIKVTLYSQPATAVAYCLFDAI